jgi:hypothetical protein
MRRSREFDISTLINSDATERSRVKQCAWTGEDASIVSVWPAVEF